MKQLAHNSLRCVLIVLAAMTVASTARPEGDTWSHYGGSPAGGQYSALTQITPDNVANMELAWSFRTGDVADANAQQFAFQSNPILAEGRLYLTTGSGIIIALDPASGKEAWRFDPHIDRSRRYAETANRGVTSWIDPEADAGQVCRQTIFTGTLDARLLAVDGATGQPCPHFGSGGQVDMSRGVRLSDGELGNYTLTSPPVVLGGVLVSGSAVGDNGAVDLEYGIVRGLDARSGELKWRFDPIPRGEDDPMHTSWRADQVSKTGAANAWPPLSADIERGIVYVPTGSPSPDFYGGERLGDDRYANSLIALDACSGAVIWHQQLVHHDLWDYDLPSQPVLAELEHAGRNIPAVIQATKMGLVFSFNRVTGEPIFPIEERAVPQGGVAGEGLSPTQPFPLAPPPLVPQTALGVGDMWGILLFDKWACRNKLKRMRSQGIYTPPSLEGTVQTPGFAGGINWGGVAFEPDRQVAVLNSMHLPMVVQLYERASFDYERERKAHPDSQFASQSGTPYVMRREALTSPLGIPCVAPPWGQLTAINMKKGEILWQVPLGSTEELAPVALDWGVPNMGGPMVTGSGLIFIAATTDNYLRAFSLASGTELWRTKLPAGGQATPMSYWDERSGRQMVVIAAGGHPGLETTPGDYVLAYRLPL